MKTWIITVTNNVNENVDLFRFVGNTIEALQRLVDFATGDTLEDYDIDRVWQNMNGNYKDQFTLNATIDDARITYTATALSEIEEV